MLTPKTFISLLFSSLCAFFRSSFHKLIPFFCFSAAHISCAGDKTLCFNELFFQQMVLKYFVSPLIICYSWSCAVSPGQLSAMSWSSEMEQKCDSEFWAWWLREIYFFSQWHWCLGRNYLSTLNQGTFFAPLPERPWRTCCRQQAYDLLAPGGGVLRISLVMGWSNGGKIKTHKQSLGFRTKPSLKSSHPKKYFTNFPTPKKSQNRRFQTQKKPSIIPVTWNPEYSPPHPGFWLLWLVQILYH